MDYDRLRELQEKFDENPRRYFAPLANEYRKGGQPKRAIEICRAHLAQMPGHMSGQIVFGQALFEAGEWDEARTVFERALTLDPENLIALRSLGDMELQAGNTSAARAWYMRLLDADPKDVAVIALISEIEESTEGTAVPLPDIPGVDPTTAEPASAGAEEPLGLERHYPVESVEDPALTPPPVAETGEAIEAITSSREDVPGALDSTAVGTAVGTAAAEPPAAEPPAAEPTAAEPPPAELPAPAAEPPAPEPAVAAAEEHAAASAEPFVNETMAQLYLQQGYRQLALKVYRQLAASRPHDQPLKDRIAEIEAADAADHPSEAPMMGRDEPSIERPAPDFDRTPIDSPPPSPGREPSIREFFATLGRRRPPRAGGGRAGGSGTHSGNTRPSDSGASLNNPAPGASLDSVFAGATVSPSDARAASRLAGAFSGTTGAGGGSRTPPTPPMPTPRVNPRLPHAQESEEDVAKFRAWLDGLTHE